MTDPRGRLRPLDWRCLACREHRHHACDWARGCECDLDRCLEHLTSATERSLR